MRIMFFAVLAAFFFLTYESIKMYAESSSLPKPFIHSVGGLFGEIVRER